MRGPCPTGVVGQAKNKNTKHNKVIKEWEVRKDNNI
jgi:hypothetical protein